MRFQADCKFCAWTQKKRGVFESLAASRAHLPKFILLEMEEQKIKDRLSELRAEYGQAVLAVRSL